MVKIAILCDSHSGIERVVNILKNYIELQGSAVKIINGFAPLYDFMNAFSPSAKTSKELWMGILTLLSTCNHGESLELNFVKSQTQDQSGSMVLYNIFEQDTEKFLLNQGFTLIHFSNKSTGVNYQNLINDFHKVETEEISNLTKTISPDTAPNYKYSLDFEDEKTLHKTIMGLLCNLS